MVENICAHLINIYIYRVKWNQCLKCENFGLNRVELIKMIKNDQKETLWHFMQSKQLFWYKLNLSSTSDKIDPSFLQLTTTSVRVKILTNGQWAVNPPRTLKQSNLNTPPTKLVLKSQLYFYSGRNSQFFSTQKGYSKHVFKRCFSLLPPLVSKFNLICITLQIKKYKSKRIFIEKFQCCKIEDFHTKLHS